jgi:hypothetical protein
MRLRQLLLACSAVAVSLPLAACAADQAQQDGMMSKGKTTDQMPKMGGMMNQRGQMPMMGGSMPMMGMMSQGGMMPMMGMADHIEGRLAFLKTELKITNAQLAQWNAVADALRGNATQLADMMKQTSAMTQGNSAQALPQRLDLHERHMAAHLDALRKVKAALLPLYASFSEEQQRAADGLFYGPAGM